MTIQWQHINAQETKDLTCSILNNWLQSKQVKKLDTYPVSLVTSDVVGVSMEPDAPTMLGLLLRSETAVTKLWKQQYKPSWQQ